MPLRINKNNLLYQVLIIALVVILQPCLTQTNITTSLTSIQDCSLTNNSVK